MMDIPSTNSSAQTWWTMEAKLIIDFGYLSWTYGGLGSKSWPSVRHLYSKKAQSLICVDSQTSHRKAFYPLYKSHRKERRQERAWVFEKVLHFQEYLREDPSLWRFEAEGFEADDLSAVLGSKIPVIGGDKDLLQIPGIHLSRITGEVLTPAHFMSKQSKTLRLVAKNTPQEILLVLSLLGDKSDDIPRLIPAGGLSTLAMILNDTRPWYVAHELFGEDLLRNLYLAILPGPWCYDPLPTPIELFDLLVKNQLQDLVLRESLSPLKEVTVCL